MCAAVGLRKHLFFIPPIFAKCWCAARETREFATDNGSELHFVPLSAAARRSCRLYDSEPLLQMEQLLFKVK
jgi:hypothetical protein